MANKSVQVKKWRWIIFVVLIAVGLVGAVCSVVLMPMLTEFIFDTVVTNMMVLNPSSAIYPDWKDPPLPLYSSFYFFHVENPDAIVMNQRPVVAEKGPYVYRIEVPRANVTFHGNGTLSSVQMYKYIFEPSLSVGPETDTFTLINPVAVSTTILAKDFPKAVKRQLSLQMVELNETVFMNRSVAEILWGYEDGFISLANKYFSIPGWDTDLFGLLWGRNNSDLGVYTVYDGTEDQSMLNTFDRFNGRTELDWWFSPEANMLNGTDGTMYHPYISRDEKLELFHPDVCRSLPYLYEKDMNFKGVPLFKFVLANYTYANGTVHPPNEGFYREDMWAPSGLLRQDPCRFGQPMALSNPHFLDGDPILYDAIDGLSPNKDDHESYLAMEERMGMPYVFKLRLQINSLLEPVEDIRQVEIVSRVYFPLVWFEQSVEVDDTIVSLYKKGFVTSEKVMDALQWFFFACGLILAAVSTYWFIRWYRRRQLSKSEEELKGTEETDVEVFKKADVSEVEKQEDNLGFEEERMETGSS
nr:scavenger receptor class B member 1 [Apostichopus japonicus]